jgi:hypothetical protein
VAEDSGNKLRRPVYGSRKLSKYSERLMNMEGPLRPRLVNCSDFQFGVVTTETIENALLHLAQQNEQAVKEAAGRTGSFRETRIVGVDAEWGVRFTGGRGALIFVFHSNILLVLLLCEVVGLISDERGLLALFFLFLNPHFPAPLPTCLFLFLFLKTKSHCGVMTWNTLCSLGWPGIDRCSDSQMLGLKAHGIMGSPPPFKINVCLYEGIQSPETEVIDSCELPYGCWELNPGPLEG